MVFINILGLDLEIINKCLLFFHEYVKARNNSGSEFLSTVEYEEHSSDFFLNIFSDAVFRKWTTNKYPFLAERDVNSILTEVSADIITRNEPVALYFDHENKFRKYLKKSFNGKWIDRFKEEGQYEVNIKVEGEENEGECEGDECDYGNGNPFIPDIENIGDPDGKNKENLMLMKVDLSRLPETVAYLLLRIYNSLTMEDDAYKTIERKIAWQVDGKYFKMTDEKIANHKDAVLKKYEYLTLVRYEHWQNWNASN